MSSRDRDTKSLQDKLKVFFKKGGTAPMSTRNELTVGPELERELSADTPLSRRLRVIKEVGEKALQIRIQEGGVEKIWSCTRDLLEDPNPEARHAVLCLLRRIAEGQEGHLLIMRTILFHYLRDTHATHSPDDTQLRFKLLYTLTNSGKNINCFEEQIGSFLLEWLPQIQQPSQIIEFLQLIINVVKFNATYLDEEIVHGIVNNACYLCVYSADPGVVQCCLSLLEAVVSYSLLPRTALRTFVAALCRTVNIEQYCQNSWKLMRYVVGADIGHAALQEMVDILRAAGEDAEVGAEAEAGADAEADAGLLRGAVFYINMALWGPRRVHTLKVSFLAVLPAFLKAISGKQAAPVVIYEVVVALQSLVTRVPHELYEPAWNVLLRIIHVILEHDKSLDPGNELIHSRVHALISSLEALQESGQYRGDPDALLDLLDCCVHDRPEASALRLVSARVGALSGAGGGAGGGAEFKITLSRQHAPRAPPPVVTSTNPKTPSPSLNGGVSLELDKVCAESVQDLMATIAKLDSNGVQVVAESPSPAQHVHSSTDADPAAALPGKSAGSSGAGGDPNEDWCAVCMDGGELMCCDKCPKVFHQYCHIPTIEKLPDETETWQCLLCVNFAELPPESEDELVPGALSPRQQRLVERITLELYCQYELSLPFREPVPHHNLHYHSKVPRPVCLDAVRMKLQPRSEARYAHVAQFVADCRLLFRNAYLYNPPDSQIYKDAKRLEEFFDAQLLKWLPEYAYWSGEGEPPAKRARLE